MAPTIVNKAAFADSEFRADNNKFLLQALFFEKTGADKSTVLYTLKDMDHLGFPSLSRLFIETNDPTEYIFATTYLGSWEHWQALTECSWFKPYIMRWRRELRVKIQSEALKAIIREAKLETKNSFTANRYLVEHGWEPKEGVAARRGRPSKEEIRKAAHEALEQDENFKDDFERIISAASSNQVN